MRERRCPPRGRERVISSCPAQAGKGDRALARWKGRGSQRTFCADNEASSQRPPPPRGACHRAGHFGPGPLAWSPSPASRGRIRQSRSRGAICARVLSNSERICSSLRGAKRRSNPELSGRTGLLRFTPNDEIKERKRNAGKRRSKPPRTQTRRAGRATEGAACAALSALGRAHLPAFHHGSRQGDLRHPRRNPGHASWDSAERSIR